MFLRVFVPIGGKNSGLVTSLGRFLIRYFSVTYISWSHLGLNQGLPDYESGGTRCNTDD